MYPHMPTNVISYAHSHTLDRIRTANPKNEHEQSENKLPMKFINLLTITHVSLSHSFFQLVRIERTKPNTSKPNEQLTSLP
jgi:hypothetical protein